MDPASAARPPAATETPTASGTSSGQAPAGYKIVKVRKPDGTLATVKRKLAPGEEPTTSAPAEAAPTDNGASKTSDGPPKFKIVTVRKADGTLVKVRRPITNSSQVAESEEKSAIHGNAQPVEPSTVVAESSTAVDKSSSTTAIDPAVVSRAVEAPKPTIAAANPTNDPKGSHAVVPVTTDADKLKPSDDSSDFRAAERELAGALAEQAIYNRQKRTDRLKSSLMRGFGMAVGSALPGLEISHDFEDGDEIMSDDDDWSVDDGDGDDGHDVDGHDLSDELHASNEADHSTGHEVENDGMPFQSTAAGHPELTSGSLWVPRHV